MNEAVQRLLVEKPTTREKLAEWVEGFLGFHAHQECRCVPKTERERLEWEKDGKAPHQSQLDYIESAFFNQHSQCVYMASRNGGKSYAAAILCILDSWWKPGIKIGVAAYTKDQSLYIYNYIEKFLDYFEAQIGRKVAKRLANEITFVNGSMVRFFSGGKSDANVTGFRPSVLYIDEADKFSQAQYDGIANCLEAGGEQPSRFDTLSTNYTLDGEGVILKTIERYEQYNREKPDHMLPAKVFRTCLLDVLKQCDDRFKCFDEDKKAHCKLWAYCKGKAKEGDGFLRIEEAINRAIATSRPDFEAEYMLLRPSSEFSYFPEFSVAEHIVDPDRPLDPSMDTFIAYDFGHGRCPQAAVIAQKDKLGNYYAIDEFLRECDLEAFCDLIAQKYPKITDAECFYDPYGNRSDSIKDSKTYAQVLRLKGYYPRCKQLKRRQTFEQLHALISPAAPPIKFFVNRRCKQLTRQIQAAEHGVVKGRPTREPADGKGDDLLDCLRYIIGWTSGTYAKHAGSKQMRFF